MNEDPARDVMRALNKAAIEGVAAMDALIPLMNRAAAALSAAAERLRSHIPFVRATALSAMILALRGDRKAWETTARGFERYQGHVELAVQTLEREGGRIIVGNRQFGLEIAALFRLEAQMRDTFAGFAPVSQTLEGLAAGEPIVTIRTMARSFRRISAASERLTESCDRVRRLTGYTPGDGIPE